MHNNRNSNRVPNGNIQHTQKNKQRTNNTSTTIPIINSIIFILSLLNHTNTEKHSGYNDILLKWIILHKLRLHDRKETKNSKMG